MPSHGRYTGVLLDAIDLSPYLTSADLSVDVDDSDTTTFGATWKTAIAGQIAPKVDASGYYDPGLGKFTPAALVAPGGVLTYGPAGLSTIGQLARLIPVVYTTYAESSPVGGVVAFKWSATSDAAVGFGWVLHPLAKDTNTTTGADRDDAAATTTGWVAHLHVTSVDAGSWVVKLQDALTTDWTDVTGGAFTAATAATQQRLVSAAGATLRRHVRYVATRTGGTAGDGITFSLSYSRNV